MTARKHRMRMAHSYGGYRFEPAGAVQGAYHVTRLSDGKALGTVWGGGYARSNWYARKPGALINIGPYPARYAAVEALEGMGC